MLNQIIDTRFIGFAATSLLNLPVKEVPISF